MVLAADLCLPLGKLPDDWIAFYVLCHSHCCHRWGITTEFESLQYFWKCLWPSERFHRLLFTAICQFNPCLSRFEKLLIEADK